MPGSPLRIPLPLDELSQRELPNAEAELKVLIADACGGDQCIGLRISPLGSLDPNGRRDCAAHLKRLLPEPLWEPLDPSSLDEGEARPVLYVARGGVITLVVELRCDESEETESGGAPSPTSTATMSP